ncbi:MAG TPA: 50S ribosomal protein L10 [Myxococcales bacterium LLY-WYZ-16_1]|nr:50S ribosomal protein L10 [Myxococcales bacterium LLY-WYZ-16_1]
MKADMPMTRQAKEEMVSVLADRLQRAKGGLIASYVGLDVASVNVIRTKFREVGAEYKVVKNTLMKRALSGTPLEELSDLFVGPTAVALKYDDELGALGKAAKALAKDFEKFEVRGAYIEQDILKGDVLETMANLPTLDEARAQLLGVFNAPASRLLAQINAPASNLIGVIKAKSEKEENAA